MAGELTEGIIPHLPLWNSRVRHAGDLQVPGRKAPFCGRTSLILLWLFTGPWVSSPQRPMSLGKMSLRSCLVTASWRYQNFLLSESINIWTRIKRLYLEISFSVTRCQSKTKTQKMSPKPQDSNFGLTIKHELSGLPWTTPRKELKKKEENLLHSPVCICIKVSRGLGTLYPDWGLIPKESPNSEHTRRFFP